MFPPAGGMRMPGYQYNSPYPSSTSTPGGGLIGNQYRLAGEATQQQAQDYSGISNTYKNAINSLMNRGPYTPTQYQSPAPITYTPTAAETAGVSNLGQLAQTGGYSAQDIADLRARGVAPVRTAYANAMQNLSRSTALQGGYSPNVAAATAKMAREQGQSMADALQSTNAGIAQAVAGNKIAISPAAAAAAATLSQKENEAAQKTTEERNQVQVANTDMTNSAKQFNLTYLPEQLQRLLQGFTGLYGTNPALSSAFSNQALNSAQFWNMMNQQGFQDLGAFGSMFAGLTRQ